MKHASRLTHLVLLLALALILAALTPGARSQPASPPDYQTATGHSLRTAALALARGDFPAARAALDSVTETPADPQLFQELGALLDQYDHLNTQMQDARQTAYAEHLEKMVAAVNDAQYRTDLLAHSTEYQLPSTAKEETETDLRTEIRNDWVTALAQLTISHNLAERVDLTETADPDLRTEIIAQGLQTAQYFQDRHDWLEAYAKAYYNLASLDRSSDQYDDQVTRLLRQATISDMYAPDPNEDGISWQERRTGVSFDIMYAGLGLLEAAYVDPPDFKEMTDHALTNCLLMAETETISPTFPQLGDPISTNAYRTGIKTALETAAAVHPDQFGKYQFLEAFQTLLRVNKDTIELPEEVVIAEFSEGAFAALDGYTYIIWPGDVADFRKDMTNEFSGVGIVINKVNGLLTVDSLLEDAPAMEAGLDAGDTIRAVDGRNTARITLEMAVRRITGPEGTDVVLTIDREGFEKPRDFTITRRRIVVQTVKGLYRDSQGDWQYFLDPDRGLAYVRVTSFSGETPGRLRAILEQLRTENMHGLILDLRDNSGGYLSAAVEMVDDFISTGPIVSTRSPRLPETGHVDYATPDGTFDENLPLVVLVNSSSASASEIVSGSLRDHQRALIVGTRTFGKGNVQQIQQFRPTKAEMKITMAYYYLPSGRRVHRNPKDRTNEDYGVEPHVKVELTGKQIEKHLLTRREAGVLHRGTAGNGEGQGDWTVYDAEKMLESDPQLAMAVICLRATLLAAPMGVPEFVGPAR